MTNVELFTKEGCSLCEKVRSVVLRVQQELRFSFHEVNLTSGSPEEETYAHEIPVVRINGVVFSRYNLPEERFRAHLKMLAREREDTP